MNQVTKSPLDSEIIRSEFPILNRQIRGNRLIYFDSGATTLKPKPVVERIATHYLNETSNVHRGIHTLSGEATSFFEAARNNVRDFLNAPSSEEIIFTRGTTHSINIVARSFCKAFLKSGDEILISELEHHSNIVPWQMACKEFGLILKVAKIEQNGELTLENVRAASSPRTKLIAVASTSNTLGTVVSIKEISVLAKQLGAYLLVDAAQSVAHEKVDVQAWDCDFLAFSAHKLFGPTGFGVLYGRAKLLDKMEPLEGGGAMIKKVTFAETTYDIPPQRFEAGTPHIAGAIGLGAAIDYVSAIGLDLIASHESFLLDYATRRLSEIPEIRMFGTAPKKGPILSFLLGSCHPGDVGTLLDEEGIAVRTGHHCTQPLMQKYNIPGTVRASFALYNTVAEVDAFILSIEKIKRILL